MMTLGQLPTFFLQMFSFGSLRFKREVDQRMAHRLAVCRRLFEQGELDLLLSLRRCERHALWIVGLLAIVGAMVGWFARDVWVGIVAMAMGAAVGAWLAGVMVDSVHALGQLVSENHEAAARGKSPRA